ncbi:thiamine pyrophosphate-binding protein [Numidum massiliense]|uniref:thiamine pyrophosphate-binding protein n=1 Tax=Numidum massiliense TaxID=1522315 RepID=UPI001E55E655|nr:thiamine pyrophosphate-binding protein [Numidum massiliense]
MTGGVADVLPSSIDKKMAGDIHSAPQNVAEVILAQLHILGVTRLYGVTGDSIFPFLDTLAKENQIHFIAVKHESVAAMMAAAEAKLTGELAVCTAHQGPGLGNLLNGLGDACADQVPVLALTGQAPRKKIGTRYKQFIDQQQFIHPVARYSTLVTDPDAIVDVLNEAIYTSLTERAVSHLSIPQDVFLLPTTAIPRPKMIRSAARPDQKTLQQAIHVMQRAERPMILTGISAKTAGRAIGDLATHWGAGIVTSHGAIDVLPQESPQLLGSLGPSGHPLASHFFRQADVVLVIGTQYWPEAHVPNARVIQVDRDASNLGIGIPAEIGLAGEAHTVIHLLLAQMAQHHPMPKVSEQKHKDTNLNQLPSLPGESWINQLREAKQTISQQLATEKETSGFPVAPARLVRALEKTAAPNAIVTLDTGDAALWLLRTFHLTAQTVLLSAHWRTMGFALPAALAAKICDPERQVIAFTGDGGLAMVLADLLTAVRKQLGIVVIVANNGTLQMELNKSLLSGYAPVATDLTNPDFVQLARACGWESYRITEEEQLEPLIARALQSTKPTLIEVPTQTIPYPNHQLPTQ